MSALSDYAENKILDALLRGQTFPTIANTYVALLTTNDNDADSAKVEVSSSGTGYARAAVASSLANWKSTQGDSSASNGNTGQTSNANAVSFGAGNTTGAWGSIVGFAVYDAPTGGNLLFYGSLGTPKTVNSGDPFPSFAAGQLTFQVDN